MKHHRKEEHEREYSNKRPHGECHFYQESMYSENLEREQRELNRMHESDAASQENMDKFYKPNGHSNVQPGPAGEMSRHHKR